jgi:hypothetical protein
VKYHWEFVSALAPGVLFEEGTTWTGSVASPSPAAIHVEASQSGAGGDVAYSASGPLVGETQVFSTFEEAQAAVDVIVKAAGHEIVTE